VVSRKYPKWLMAAMGLGTAGFVVAQLFAGATLKTSTYPVVSFPMFADSPNVDIEPQLTAVTADGVTHHMSWQDFGLTHDQLKFFVQRKIAANDGTVQMGAKSKLQFLGDEWRAKHGDPQLTSVSLSFQEHVLDGSGRVDVVPIVTWTSTS
jgi:hypothetical protein